MVVVHLSVPVLNHSIPPAYSVQPVLGNPKPALPMNQLLQIPAAPAAVKLFTNNLKLIIHVHIVLTYNPAVSFPQKRANGQLYDGCHFPCAGMIRSSTNPTKKGCALFCFVGGSISRQSTNASKVGRSSHPPCHYYCPQGYLCCYALITSGVATNCPSQLAGIAEPTTPAYSQWWWQQTQIPPPSLPSCIPAFQE